jgi:hypothetical protein
VRPEKQDLEIANPRFMHRRSEIDCALPSMTPLTKGLRKEAKKAKKAAKKARPE